MLLKWILLVWLTAWAQASCPCEGCCPSPITTISSVITSTRTQICSTFTITTRTITETSAVTETVKKIQTRTSTVRMTSQVLEIYTSTQWITSFFTQLIVRTFPTTTLTTIPFVTSRTSVTVLFPTSTRTRTINITGPLFSIVTTFETVTNRVIVKTETITRTTTTNTSAINFGPTEFATLTLTVTDETLFASGTLTTTSTKTIQFATFSTVSVTSTIPISVLNPPILSTTLSFIQFYTSVLFVSTGEETVLTRPLTTLTYRQVNS